VPAPRLASRNSADRNVDCYTERCPDGGSAMTLTQEDIEFIKANMGDWLAEQSLGKPPAVYEIELRERMVRVEEALSHQRELMREGFAQMERRFEQIDKRFEQVDKRFEQMERRFEQVDKRFESMQATMDQRFENMTRRIDRFMIWSFASLISVGGIIVGLVKFWNP
jgi:predicted nuclease with TOPRIM domain